MAFDAKHELGEQLQDTLATLKKSADDFEDVKLTPTQSMLLFRFLTEGAGVRFDGRKAKAA